MKNLKYAPWGFVEKYYPNYYSSKKIADNDDLFQLVDNSFEVGGSVDTLLNEKYKGEINDPQIQIDFQSSLIEIYEASILEYLKQQN